MSEEYINPYNVPFEEDEFMLKGGDDSIELVHKTVPKTSPTHYISDMCALNMSVDGVLADWHPLEYLYTSAEDSRDLPTFGDGPNALYNTNPIWGDYGIIECAATFERWGLLPIFDKVYRANHHRAILDLIYIDMVEFKLKYLHFKLSFFPRRQQKISYIPKRISQL